VTEADLAAERINRRPADVRPFPDIPCVAEELCEGPREMPPCCDRFWAIDPLDGNARVRRPGNGEFSVLIALVEEGRAGPRASCMGRQSV